MPAPGGEQDCELGGAGLGLFVHDLSPTCHTIGPRQRNCYRYGHTLLSAGHTRTYRKQPLNASLFQTVLPGAQMVFEGGHGGHGRWRPTVGWRRTGGRQALSLALSKAHVSFFVVVGLC